VNVQTEHLDKLAAYIAEHGEQRQGAISDGMRLAHPDIDVRRYLFKLLRKQGRIEKVGYDSYRSLADAPDDEQPADAELAEALAEARADSLRAEKFEPLAFDVAKHLSTPDAIAEYVIAVFEDGNQELISSAIGDVASAMALLLVKKEAAPDLLAAAKNAFSIMNETSTDQTDTQWLAATVGLHTAIAAAEGRE